jgi:hypothetical protein
MLPYYFFILLIINFDTICNSKFCLTAACREAVFIQSRVMNFVVFFLRCTEGFDCLFNKIIVGEDPSFHKKRVMNLQLFHMHHKYTMVAPD